MATAFIKKTDSTTYMSAPDYISQFYGDKEGISETKILSSPLVVTTLEYLFSNFIGLEYANFNNLVSTSKKAFAGCVSLKEINFPNLSYIESYTFENCNNLKSVYFPKCISAKNNIFNGCNSLEEINMPIYSRWTDYSYRFKISNLPKLNFISLPKIERNIILENLPRLEDINLDSLSYVGAIDYGNSSSGGSHVYFKNLPSVEALVLNSVKFLYPSAFMSISNLKYLILQECESIKANVFTENISEYILPKNVIFSLPKVSSINFSYNGIFKSINLPAVTDFRTFATGWMFNQPYYIGLPNVSIISSNAIFSYICESKPLSHDIIFDLPELEIIKQSAFEGDTRRYGNTDSPYGYILKTPKLSILESGAFFRSYNTKCLKEIDLNNISMLNEDVFLNTFNPSNSGIFFRNLNNIKEVKQGAFANAKINSDTLYLPNCERFDFKQGYEASYYPKLYSLAIRRYNAGSNAGSYYYISNLILPKLSEIIINPDDGYVSNYVFYNAMNLFPENMFSLETCKQIIFNDGSRVYANGYTSLMWYKKCNILYIPECSILRYSYNEVINISYRSMLFNIRELYAPKLEVLDNILFRDLHKITIPSTIHELNLEYTYGNVSIIDFSQSFSGYITLYNNYSYSSQYRGSYTLFGINLPNFSGYFEFDTDFYWSSYVSADRNGDFNIILGENIEKTYIDLGAMIQYYDENNLKNINTYIQKSVIDTNIYYNDLFYNSESAHANLYMSNCQTINYTIFSSVLMLTSNSIKINISDNTSYGTVFHVGGFISAPLLESINIYISYNQLSLSTDIQDPTSLSYNFPNIEIQGYTNELYAPKLSKLNVIFPNEVQQYISMYRPIIDFGYDRPAGLTSITLGISEMSDLFNGTFSDGIFSAYNRWEYLNDRYITYLSFSRLNCIPGYHFSGINWSDWTFYLTNATQVNFDNISYISYHGLYIGKIERISFPNLLYMEDTAFNAPNLRFISFPKLQSLGAVALYSCSNMQILSLPSTCSKFSTNALPSNFEVLDLYYNGVVSGSLWGGSYWHSTYHSSEHIVRVPSSYLSSYKNDAFWGSYLSSFHFNIVAM